MDFQDIPQFTPSAPYTVHGAWHNIEDQLKDWNEVAYGSPLNLDPDFQRGHVWTEKKQREYVEFILRGGQSSKDIYMNHPRWMDSFKGEMTLVDGKQRLEAVRKFMRNELKVFGMGYRKDFSNRRTPSDCMFIYHINTLKTRAEILQWYLDLNTGGVVHTDEEIKKVKALLKKEEKCT